MIRPPRPARLRSRVIAGAAAASLACAGSALAASANTAKVSVPKIVPAGTSMTVKVTGTAAKNHTRLDIFLAQGCRKSAKAEEAVSGARKVIDVFVGRIYTSAKKVNIPISTPGGTYYACAYLGPVAKPLTHPHGTYTVTVGQYPH